jgi:chitinase
MNVTEESLQEKKVVLTAAWHSWAASAAEGDGRADKAR